MIFLSCFGLISDFKIAPAEEKNKAIPKMGFNS